LKRSHNPVVNSTPLCLNSDAIFNSTAKNSADLLHGDTDLSLISNIGHDFAESFFPNALIQNQPNSEQNVDLPVSNLKVFKLKNFNDVVLLCLHFQSQCKPK
jgi:hypothetical protein